MPTRLMKNWLPPVFGPALAIAMVPLVILIVAGELVLDGVARSPAARSRRVPALNHEAVDDPMEDGAIVESLLHQLLEVAGGDGHIIVELRE